MDHPCPEPQRLLGLIDGTLPDDEQAGLTAHLEHCTGCQRDLEELAGGTDWLADKARYLGYDGPAKETALKDVEEVLKVAGPEEETANVASAAAEVSLDFLDPPETPGHLGRLGDYEVIEVIGSGGMGVVLKAFEESLARAVAIKVLSPALGSSATARRRFIREAQAAAAVSHDHVVTIHAVDEANGLPYLVMQYVSGMSLEEKIAQAGPLEVKEVLRIGMQIASGLAAAHAQGLIHRDIKPANILLENGVERVKITDFGLARAVDDASVTETGVVAGTPQYMAPEQARGDVVDHRADLFSLGSVLYATCTGRPPFRGTQTLAVLRRVADETPPSILELNCELPVWLAEIVERLHAKDPGQRYQSADEVARVLAGHLAGLQQPSSPGVHLDPVFEAERTPSGKAKEGRRVGPAPKVRRRWMAAAVAVLVLAGGLGITEATDVTAVTEYVATVLRIRTPQGTLVVKVDDPDVEVTVEGDGETITLRGVGAHEIRLRPGRHKVEAIRDGRPISTEWATITRGGKEVVTVNLEGEVAGGAAGVSDRPVITGRAYLGDPSRPAANQKLWLYDAAAMEIHRHLHTGEQGNFTSGPLSQGEYFLLAKMIDGRTGEPTPYFVQSRPFYLYGEEPPRVELDLLIKSRLLIRAAGPFVDRVEVEGRTVQLGIRFDVTPEEPRLPLKPDPLADELAPHMGLRKDHSFGPFLQEELPWTIAIPPGRYQVRATVGRLTDPHFKVRARSVISYQLGGGYRNSLDIGEGEEVELRYALPEGYDAWVRSLVASLEGKKSHTKIEKPSAATLKKVATRKLPDLPAARGDEESASYTEKVRELVLRSLNEPSESPRYAGRTLREWLAVLETERKPEQVMDGIRAMVALREPGLEREAAEAIFKVMRHYDLKMIDASPEGMLKTAAIKTFGKLDSDAALDVLRDVLKSGNETDRRFALWVLSWGERAPIRTRAKEVIPALLEVSANESPEFRRWALRVLVQIDPTSEQVVKRLQDALSDNDPQVILAAAKLLVQAAPDTDGLVTALLELAKGPDETLQARAVSDLVELGLKEPSAVLALASLLREKTYGRVAVENWASRNSRLIYMNITLRGALIRDLGDFGPKAKDAVPLIKAELEDDDPQIRQAAAEALKKIAKSKLPDVPMERADQALRHYAGKTLGEWLAAFKIERDPATLAKGIEAIGALRETGRDRELADAIVEVVGRYDLTTTGGKTAEGEVKQTAIRVFGQFDSPAALSVLNDALKGDDDNLRWFAIRVLSRMRPRPAPIRSKAKSLVPALLEVSNNESPEFRRWALLVVAQIDPTSERVVKRLQDALSDDGPHVVLAAAGLLVKAAPDTEALVPTLVDLIGQKDSKIQVESIQHLAKLGRTNESAVAGLASWLHDKDFGRSRLSETVPIDSGNGLHIIHIPHNLRSLIIETLGRLGPKAKDAVSLLNAELEDEDTEVRRVAAEALNKIKQD